MVTLLSDETSELDVVVRHEEDGHPVVDHVEPVRVRAGETLRVEIRGLAEGPAYEVQAAPRGEVAPPTPGVQAWPALASVAESHVVTARVQPAFDGLPTGRRATVFAPDAQTLLVVRENVAGGLEATLSHDGGRSFGAPLKLSPPAREPGSVRVYWDETRFADGTLGIAYRQFEEVEANERRDWTLVRIDPSRDAILEVQTLAFDHGQHVEGESLEVFTLPNGRTLLLAETKDLRASYSIDSPTALRVWTLTREGALADEVAIPLEHGVMPRFETASTVGGVLRIAWTHGASADGTSRHVWTTTSTDGGHTFSSPAATELPLAHGASAQLASADISPDGTLHAAVVAEEPFVEANQRAIYHVRLPIDGAATVQDLRALPMPPDGPTEWLDPQVVALGDQVLVQWFGGEAFVAESLDGGRTFDAVMRLRAPDSGFYVTDSDSFPDGRPIFMTTSERCKNCFASLFDDALEIGHWAAHWGIQPEAWGPADTPPIAHMPPPERVRVAPEVEPTRPTPGFAPLAALAAFALLALGKKRYVR